MNFSFEIKKRRNKGCPFGQPFKLLQKIINCVIHLPYLIFGTVLSVTHVAFKNHYR